MAYKKNQKGNSIKGLLLAQFTEAFSDNAWKLVVITLAARAFIHPGMWDDQASHNSQLIISRAIQTFLIPMLLFALPAGLIADKWSKRSIILVMKAIGVSLMGMATVVLFFSPHNLWFAFLVLALMGAQSATFNPAKNGILPEILPQEKLSFANGIVQMTNMLAIIAGTGLGSILLYFDNEGFAPSLTWTAPFFLTLMALAAFLAALSIPKVSAAAADNEKNHENNVKNKFDIMFSAWRAIRSDKTLGMAVKGTALFWTMTSLTGQNLLVYSQALVHHMTHGELWQGVPTAAFGLGIAIGALFSGKIAGDYIEAGLIPFGTLLFAAISFAIGIFTPQMVGTVCFLILLGAGAGILIVPLQALMQTHAPANKRGAVLAISNTCDIVGLILGSLMAMGMSFLGWNLQVILIVSSFLAIAAAFSSLYLLPGHFIQTIFLIGIKLGLIKPRLSGQLPDNAILTSSSLTLFDLFVIRALLRRPIIGVISPERCNRFWLKHFGKKLNIIPEGEEEFSLPSLVLYLNNAPPSTPAVEEDSKRFISLQRQPRTSHYEITQ